MKMRSFGTKHSGNCANDGGFAFHRAIKQALDPRTLPNPVKFLSDMSAEQRAEMERLYGCGPKDPRRGCGPKKLHPRKTS